MPDRSDGTCGPVLIGHRQVNGDIEEAGMTSSAPSHAVLKSASSQHLSVLPASRPAFSALCTLRLLAPATGQSGRVPHPT
jgi:hypothetical protein